jgi:hypothetical protein
LKEGSKHAGGFHYFHVAGSRCTSDVIRICFDDLWCQKCTIRVCWSSHTCALKRICQAARSRVSPVAVPLTPIGISFMGWNYMDSSWLRSALPWKTGRSWYFIYFYMIVQWKIDQTSNVKCHDCIDSNAISLLYQTFTSESQSLSNYFRVSSQSHSAPQNHQLRLDRRFHLLRSSAKSMTRHGRTLFWGNASWERLLSMSEGILVL